MRILLATHFYPPGHLGGTEVLTAGLARHLLAAGHAVQVVCAEDWGSAPSHVIRPSDDQVDGVPVRRLHFNWQKAPDVFRYLYDNPAAAAQVGALMDSFQPDVVHVTSCYALSGSVIAAAQRRGRPVVVSATDFWLLCARNTLLRSDDSLCPGPADPWECARCHLAEARAYRWPRRLLPEPAVRAALLAVARVPAITNQPALRGRWGDWGARLAYMAAARRSVDHIVTASAFLRDRLVAYGVPADRLSHSAYGLDTAWARGHQAKTPSAQLRLGFIGQILPMKGPDLLLRALADLAPDLPVRLTVYGDLAKSPAYGQRLRALAAGDPRVTFAGTFPNDQMGRVLSEIDVLAVPSTWYDFPLVIPSAFAAGTPVLATDLPGMNEWVTAERNGLLFARYDWRGLAGQIRRLALEPGLVARLRGGVPAVKTLAAMTDEYLAVYDQVLAGRAARRGAGPAELGVAR